MTETLFFSEGAGMTAAGMYRILADAVLVMHFTLVAFIIGGLALILAGNRAGWAWVNRLWFRIAHLAAIALVTAESWLGMTCPLTALEDILRVYAGSPVYGESFIGYWLHRIMFYEAPPWAFALAYTAFALLVAAAWLFFPPGHRKPQQKSDAS